jgi:hypothetical protein
MQGIWDFRPTSPVLSSACPIPSKPSKSDLNPNLLRAQYAPPCSARQPPICRYPCWHWVNDAETACNRRGFLLEPAPPDRCPVERQYSPIPPAYALCACILTIFQLLLANLGPFG